MKHRAKIGEDAMAGSGGVAAMGREDRMKVRCRSCAARSNLRLLVNTSVFFSRAFSLRSQTSSTKTMYSGAGAPVVAGTRDFASLRPSLAPPHVIRRLRRHRRLLWPLKLRHFLDVVAGEEELFPCSPDRRHEPASV